MTRYTRLERLLAAMAGADGGPVAGPSDAVEAAVAAAGPPTELRETAREIDALLGAGLCEYQIAHLVLYELGSPYDPARDGLEVSEWLRRVRARLLNAPGDVASEPPIELSRYLGEG